MMESIWWTHIRKAADYIETVVNAVLSGQSVILSSTDIIPWPAEMWETVENLLRERNPAYRLIELGDPGEEPDKFMLEHFCRRESRARYRTNIGAAKFLAELPDSTLHSSYVRIRLTSESGVKNWTAFASEYSRLSTREAGKGCFLLEASGVRNLPRLKGVKVIDWDEMIDTYDVYSFCAVYSAGTGISSVLRPYLVELTSTICQNDVELAKACMDAANDFVRDPLQVLQGINENGQRSNGDSFRLPSEEMVESAVWEAQFRSVFPALEKFRGKYVKQNVKMIAACLPIPDYGNRLIKDPREVEFKHLANLAGAGKLNIPQNEFDLIDFLRKKRNVLAHLSTIEFEDVRRILALS